MNLVSRNRLLPVAPGELNSIVLGGNTLGNARKATTAEDLWKLPSLLAPTEIGRSGAQATELP